MHSDMQEMTSLDDPKLTEIQEQLKGPTDKSASPAEDFVSSSPEYFFYLLFQVNWAHDSAANKILRPLGLDIPRWRCLTIIRRMTNCTMKTLATYSGLERTSLTRIADLLVGRGLVDRYVPGYDRRQVNLVLTPAGDALYVRSLQALIEQNLSTLSGVEREHLEQATRVLQGALRRLIEDPQRAGDLLGFQVTSP